MCLGLACLGFALGCTAKRADPSVAYSEPEIVVPSGALVMLAADGTVYRGREDSVGVPLAGDAKARPNGYPVKVLAVVGTRLEVRTLGPDDAPTCAGNLELADDYELRFWVERAQLRDVLVEPQAFAYADGTKLELRPGVPVLDVARGELDVLGQSLFVELADTQIGLAWALPTTVALDEAKLALRKKTSLRYGDQARSLVGGAAPFTHASEVLELEGAIDGEQLIVFDNTCGRFSLRAPAGAVSSGKSGIYSMRDNQLGIPRMARNFDPDLLREAGIPGPLPASDTSFGPYGHEAQPSECAPSRWTIASGVALSWAEGGGPAGSVRRAHELPQAARELEDRVCFELDGLSLCADTSKLGRKLDPNCQAQAGGPGFGGQGTRVPMVRQAKASVGPGLDRELVRRVVRAHINEVRSCYGFDMQRRANLQGRVAVAFVVAASGQVVRSELKESTMASATTEACIVAAVGRWRFPKPKGGVSVEVVYPFSLSPG